MNLSDIVPKPGERLFVAGKTGSGKTALAIHILQAFDVPPVIYDTKVEPKFDRLPKSIVVYSPEELIERYNNNVDVNEENGSETTIHDYFIVRPDATELLDPLAMDEKWLWSHYNYLHGVPAHIDELVQWHNNTRPGVGLLSLYQRVRSKGIPVISLTQRPRNVSIASLSEADKYIGMQLMNLNDRKRVAEFVPDFEIEKPLSRYWFRFFESGEENSVLCQPLPLDSLFDLGYTDSVSANSVPSDDEDNEPVVEWL